MFCGSMVIFLKQDGIWRRIKKKRRFFYRMSLPEKSSVSGYVVDMVQLVEPDAANQNVDRALQYVQP